MKKLFLDFESFWSDEFTLGKLSPIEYINDQRFEALGCGFVDDDGTRLWVDGPDLPRFFQRLDWPNIMAISHNALFDMVILSSRYGIVPGMYGDTLSMARNWLSYQMRSLSLKKLAERYGLPAKMETVNKTKGIGFAQLKALPGLYAETRTYAIDDALKCKAIFERMMAEGFPEGELETIDMVIRMATQPRFELDATVLSEHLNAVRAKKQALLDAIQMDRENLSSIMSDQQLAAKLLFLGVNPVPMKISKTTGKLAYAFAKTDRAFLDLLEHDEPMVQGLVAARLGHKSTLEETRTERLLSIERVVRGMPVPLRYSGAHTHRFSGDWNINLQNLPRPNSDGSGGELRRAFRAPKGMKVVAVDASQIEARINAEFSRQDDLVEAFRRGEDVYASFAKDIYGYEVDKIRHPVERFVGKTGILSLGYGSSWPVFQAMCRNKGGVDLDDMAASRIVGLYRKRYSKIVDNWWYAGKQILPLLLGSDNLDDAVLADLRRTASGGKPHDARWGPMRVMARALLLPNENRLRYGELQMSFDEKGKPNYTFKRGDMVQRIYGAKLVENGVQALAFIHIMETAKRVKATTSFMPQHQVHDELIYVVDERDADSLMALVVHEMSTPPKWMPNAPLAAEGHIGQNYWEAK